MPTKFLIGDNILQSNEDIFNIGKNCLIVTGKSSAKASGALDDVIEILDKLNIESFRFNKVSANPYMSVCLEAGNYAYINSVDFVVGIGGGSVLDAAKIVSVVATNPYIRKDDIYSTNWKNKPLPLILVGTTSGTGSEVTKVAVITDDEDNRKKSIKHDDLFATYAFGDPKYTKTMNLDNRISTSVDALAHCIESYFSNVSDEISRGYAVCGIRLLLDVYRNIDLKEFILNDDHRQKLYNASIFGGLAINDTGTTFPHNLGYYLTEQFHIPHGIACAIYLNDLLAFENQKDTVYFNKFFKEIDCTYSELLSILSNLIGNINIQMGRDEIELILPRYKDNSSIKKTKGDISFEEIRRIIESKFLK